jgi:hypothetical protein
MPSNGRPLEEEEEEEEEAVFKVIQENTVYDGEI